MFRHVIRSNTVEIDAPIELAGRCWRMLPAMASGIRSPTRRTAMERLQVWS